MKTVIILLQFGEKTSGDEVAHKAKIFGEEKMIFAIGAGLEVEMITDGEVLIRIGAVLEKRIITSGVEAALEANIFRVGKRMFEIKIFGDEKRMFGFVFEATIFGDENGMFGIVLEVATVTDGEMLMIEAAL